MTGNVVLPTNQGGPSSWTGAVYQANLTCWRWGDPGYCGPNPIVRPGNNINFSFGSSYIYQQQDVSSLLPSSTPGLQISGYEFQFRAKNGNGWDDARTDQLTALVRFWDTTGGRGTNNLLYGQSYNLNYKFNWTTFNFKELFVSPLDATSIGQVQYGFLGKDNNGWAGPYGPEVTNISFALRYKVDTCTIDPLSSSSCPGYTTALLNSLPKSVAVQEGPSPVQDVIATGTPTLAAPTTSTPTSSPTSVVEAPQQQTTQQTTSSSTPATTSISAASVASVTPSANNPQPKVGEVTVAGSQSSASKSSMSTSQILSIIGSEQSRLGKLEMSTAAAAVDQAKQDAAKVTGDALSVAAAQQAQTLANSQQLLNSITPGGPQNLGSGLQFGASQSFTGLSQNNSFSISSGNMQNAIGLNIAAVQTNPSSFGPDPVSITRRIEQDIFKQQAVEAKESSSQFTSVTDPVGSVLNAPINVPAQPPISPGPVVNRNARPNEAAGSRDIGSIATSPLGFDAYSQLILRDAAFYKPHEVYKGQVNVDNARALRQLSSDRLHRELVNQQYKNN
jgi:hypothetical protein